MTTTTQKEHLQPWYDKWLEEHADTDLIYTRSGGKIQLSQVHFVRDQLSAVFWQGIPRKDRPPAPPRDGCKQTAFVIGEHHSKSVRLPVYLLERPDLGLKVVLRDNYHDWNISVVSETPVEADLRGFVLDYRDEEEQEKFRDGYKPGRYWGYCFFQGFPDKYWFGPYSENPRKFSLYNSSDYITYTLVWLLMREAMQKKEESK